MIAHRPVTVILILVVLSLLPVIQTPAAPDTTAVTPWFTSNDNAVGDAFGAIMSMSGNTVVIGDYDDSRDAPWSGAAYVFVKDDGGWVQQQKLFPTAPALNRPFGLSVAVDGDTIVVGSPGE